MPDEFVLPPRMSLLDVREAPFPPIENAVSIPLSQLPGRLHELPPGSESILIANTGDSCRDAVAFFNREGRTAELTPDFKFTNVQQRGRLWDPNPFLTAVLPHLIPGKAMDIGCGGGREAVVMAAAGWKVLAVDQLPECISRGESLASFYLPVHLRESIDWVNGDVRDVLQRVDLVTGFFFLDRSLFASLIDVLRPGGSLVWETFTVEHRRLFGKPRSDDHVLEMNELPTLLHGMEVLQYEEGFLRGRHTARVWARK